MSGICAVLGIARRTAYYVGRASPGGRYHRADDATVLQQIWAVTSSRATYGYRRVWAMVNRTFRVGYNRKRVRSCRSTGSCWPRASTDAMAGRTSDADVQPALVLGRFPDSVLEW